jgi:hypothetical protein
MTTREERRLTQIGLDRLVRLKWLEETASLVLAGNTDAAIKEILRSDLRGAFRSENSEVRGSIDKSITILLKVWLRVPPELEPLRADGLALLRRLSPGDHMAIQWGMVMAAYPFWANVAVQVGRLLRLQGSAAAIQVQRRIREQYGERETVARRARYVLRSHLDWGVLQETGVSGVYGAAPAQAVRDPQLVAWLAEAALWARANGAAPLREVLEGPSLFPFQLAPITSDRLVSDAPRLEILRHGLDDALVMLRREGKYG